MKKYNVLGAMSPQKFLREYWHKRPLLIRGAIAGFKPVLSREALFGMAADPAVESRLITHQDERWTVEHGPFKRLPSTRKPHWTALIQGVNLHDDKAAALLEQFRFIPDARLDDLMISYATDGGGVGPHFDSYDVFLLQALGRRRWRISAQDDLTLVEGLPLKILKHFEAEEEYVLEPGDMLYLPPHVAHDGIAEGECMTYSIGFRAPSYQELGENFLAFLADGVELQGRYADPDLRFSRRPAQLQAEMLDRIATEIRKLAFDDEDIAIFVGEYLSEPKPAVVFRPPTRPLTRTRFLEAARRRGVRLARQTRMLYRGRHLFINGESFIVGSKDRHVLSSLADARVLDAQELQAVSHDVEDALHHWYEDGWVRLR
ncbi:MAG TPA: cupin domain-containing protein [Noviherbaspirillum sp.]|nr:cupin domain-containing protein [Noviherbaspirillum sp.]